MNRNSFKTWLDALGKAWVDRNPKGAADICTNDVKYYETPFGEPLKSPQEVQKTWEEVPQSQKDIEFGYEIISVDHEQGVARWWATFTRTPSGVSDTLDGIFVVKLNDDGLCKEFHQWWVVKPKS